MIPDVPGHLERLTAAHHELAQAHEQTRQRLARIPELELELDRLRGRLEELAAELDQAKRRNTQLAGRVEQLLALKVGPPGKDGRPGAPGLDGLPGPAGDAGATVIREVRISG